MAPHPPQAPQRPEPEAAEPNDLSGLAPETPEGLLPRKLLAASIDAILPQTQCQRCGYPACRPYAEAIASGEAPINRCPPGGQAGIEKLARLTGSPVLPLDPSCGIEGPVEIARIDEERCIGCTLCISACPVDAIVGAFKFMHQVITEDCTGCALCLPPCPVDCITMVLPTPPITWNETRANRAHKRFERHVLRLSDSGRASEEADHQTESETKRVRRQEAILQAARARAARRRLASDAGTTQ